MQITLPESHYFQRARLRFRSTWLQNTTLFLLCLHPYGTAGTGRGTEKDLLSSNAEPAGWKTSTSSILHFSFPLRSLRKPHGHFSSVKRKYILILMFIITKTNTYNSKVLGSRHHNLCNLLERLFVTLYWGIHVYCLYCWRQTRKISKLISTHK